MCAEHYPQHVEKLFVAITFAPRLSYSSPRPTRTSIPESTSLQAIKALLQNLPVFQTFKLFAGTRVIFASLAFLVGGDLLCKKCRSTREMEQQKGV